MFVSFNARAIATLPNSSEKLPFNKTAEPPCGVSSAFSGHDPGLRRDLTGVSAFVGGGLVLSAAVAFAVAGRAPLAAIHFGTPLKWVAILAPLALVMFVSRKFERLSTGDLLGPFWSFAAVMGASLASALLVFTGASIRLPPDKLAWASCRPWERFPCT